MAKTLTHENQIFNNKSLKQIQAWAIGIGFSVGFAVTALLAGDSNAFAQVPADTVDTGGTQTTMPAPDPTSTAEPIGDLTIPLDEGSSDAFNTAPFVATPSPSPTPTTEATSANTPIGDLTNEATNNSPGTFNTQPMIAPSPTPTKAEVNPQPNLTNEVKTFESTQPTPSIQPQANVVFKGWTGARRLSTAASNQTQRQTTQPINTIRTISNKWSPSFLQRQTDPHTLLPFGYRPTLADNQPVTLAGSLKPSISLIGGSTANNTTVASLDIEKHLEDTKNRQAEQAKKLRIQTLVNQWEKFAQTIPHSPDETITYKINPNTVLGRVAATLLEGKPNAKILNLAVLAKGSFIMYTGDKNIMNQRLSFVNQMPPLEASVVVKDGEITLTQRQKDYLMGLYEQLNMQRPLNIGETEIVRVNETNQKLIILEKTFIPNRPLVLTNVSSGNETLTKNAENYLPRFLLLAGLIAISALIKNEFDKAKKRSEKIFVFVAPEVPAPPSVDLSVGNKPTVEARIVNTDAADTAQPKQVEVKSPPAQPSQATDKQVFEEEPPLELPKFIKKTQQFAKKGLKGLGSLFIQLKDRNNKPEADSQDQPQALHELTTDDKEKWNTLKTFFSDISNLQQLRQTNREIYVLLLYKLSELKEKNGLGNGAINSLINLFIYEETGVLWWKKPLNNDERRDILAIIWDEGLAKEVQKVLDKKTKKAQSTQAPVIDSPESPDAESLLANPLPITPLAPNNFSPDTSPSEPTIDAVGETPIQPENQSYNPNYKSRYTANVRLIETELNTLLYASDKNRVNKINSQFNDLVKLFKQIDSLKTNEPVEFAKIALTIQIILKQVENAKNQSPKDILEKLVNSANIIDIEQKADLLQIYQIASKIIDKDVEKRIIAKNTQTQFNSIFAKRDPK